MAARFETTDAAWRAGGAGGAALGRISDAPTNDAVALPKTVKGFFMATKAATVAAMAKAADFNRREDLSFRLRPNFGRRRSSSKPDRKSGTLSSGRNSSRRAIERAG